MFVPPVAKPKSAEPRQSTVAAQLPSRSAIELSGQSTSTARNEPGPREDEDNAESMIGRSTVPSWDFAKVPVSFPGRAERLQMPPFFPTPGLAIQAKLKVGTINDPLEHEADSVADQVLRMPDPGVSVASAPPQISRKCDDCKDEETVQKKEAESQTAAGEAPGIVHQVLRSPGQPLDPASRAYFEPRFRHDFSRVRVHTDQRAADAARGLAARAFTVGEHIVFGGNQYTPNGANGARLLAHELTHVVQQSGGGAEVLHPSDTSVSRQSISPSGIALRRDDKMDQRVRELALDRPGAAWPYGPITKHKSATHDLYDYVLMVKHVEHTTGLDKQSVLQQLRRLYYSSYSGKPQYDEVIAEQGAGGNSQTPLDTRRIGLTAIDGLYETNVLRLPDGELIDVSHVLAALDVKTSGLTHKAAMAEGPIGIKWLGVLTWAGDLASWMANYIKDDRKSPEGPPPPADPAPQKVDLISDMDAQILAEENVRPSTPESRKAERRVYRGQNIDTELSKPVSEILEDYYGIGKGTAQPPNLRNRFTAFVRIAAPPIPHKSAKPDGSGPITLTADAPDAIYDAIYNTARLLVVYGTAYSYGEDVLKLYTGHFREVARRFAQFLTTGLEKGDATWPAISFNP
jgi:Domain of unknown function (DUF4157)